MTASSWAGMPSVMQTMNVIPPSAASMIASAANFGRHDDEGRGGPGRGDGLFHRVEDRDAVDVARRPFRA